MSNKTANILYVFFASIFYCHVLIAQSAAEAKLTMQAKDNIIKNACNALIKNYVYPDKAKLMADYLAAQNRAGKYDSISNPNELASRLIQDILLVNSDKHLRIVYDPQLEKEVMMFVSSKKERINISRTDIAKEAKKNFYFNKIEILPCNIGYIEFTGFAIPCQASRKTINAAMQFIAHTDALIIDLRNNYGGNGSTADEIASYFFNTKTYTGRSFNRIENKWTNQYIANKKAITQGLSVQMPVYILTSERTFSAAEGLAYLLKNLKHAFIVGDTTRGGAHLTRSFSIGSGFVAFIPYLRGENAITKTDWEGTGVIPDVPATEGNSLAVAQNIILNEKLANATNEIEQRKLRYTINYNRSKGSAIVIDSAEALKLVGRFEEFEVSLQGRQLMFRDTHQPALSYRKMTAITPLLFQVENDLQVEFAMDNASCKALKLYWNDGYEDQVPKAAIKQQ